MFKSIINFFRVNISALILLSVTVAALIALNAYVLNFTHGTYNMFDVLFM